jgi:nucleotide-binding universal stress UspA family protein
MAYSNILIALDGSKCSLNAVNKGIELAKELSANVILLCVVDVTNMIDSAAVGVIIDKDVEVIYGEEAEKMIENAIEKYPYDKITRIAEEGIPKEAINTIAERNKVDLIIMGTHGRTGLSHLFMGSVAEYVIRHSTIPVMVVTSAD